MSDLRIGVLIVTYNRISLLRECVDAVMGQTHAASALYVVDNKSDDGTAEYLAGIDDARLRVILSDENLGGAGGFALGVSEALGHDDYDWLILIDDDAILASDYLEKMAQAVAEHRTHALFAGAVKCEGAVDTNHRRRIKNRLIFSEEWMASDLYEGAGFTCDMATFCGLMIRRDVMESAGVPRGDYFIWYDDTEYCLRCEKQAASLGYSTDIKVIPTAVIDHRSKPVMAGGDILMRTDWRSYYGWRNRYDVARTYLGWLTAFVVKCEYYVLRFKSRTMARSNDKSVSEQGRFNVRMITDVLFDIRSGRFGKREDYTRG